MTAGDALRLLAQQGRIKSPWLAGMLVRGGGYLPQGPTAPHWGAVSERLSAAAEPHLANASLDLTDPATVGCLLALLRELVEPWTPHPHRGCGATTVRDHRGWHVWVWTGPHARDQFGGPSEGEAIAAALVWCAGWRR